MAKTILGQGPTASAPPRTWNQADMDTWREETGQRGPTGNLHIAGVHGARPANGDPRSP